MKKIFLQLFITSIFLSACAAGNTTSTAKPSTTPSATKKPQVESTVETGSRLAVNKETLKGLEITVWTPWYGIESTLFDSFVADFNAQNEWGINVTVQSQVNFSNLYETVTASLPTVEKPDLVIALPEHALEWNADDFVTDLTPYVNDPEFGIDSNDIPSVFWEQDISEEIRVAIPAQRTANFLLWNETWASTLGFNSIPADPQDFRQQACRAQQSLQKDEAAQNDFMGGWAVDTEPATAYAWLLAFDGGVLEGNNYRFLKPNNIDAFKFLRELSETSCAWQTTSEMDPIASFVDREALFISATLENLPTVARAFASVNNTDTWKVIPYPAENQDTLIVYGSSYVILDSTDESQLAAWLFVRWLLENEQDARWVEATHLFPLRTSTIDLLADYEKTHPQWAQAISFLPQGEVQPQAASWRRVKIVLGDGFRHMYRVSTPSGQVAAILAQMQSTANDLVK